MSAKRFAAPDRLVCGSGGSRAILASGGAIYALHRAGFNNWKSLGGISGGSIPTALLAAGFTPTELIKFAVDIDFSSLLTRRRNIVLTFMAFLLKERLAQTRPRTAVLGSEKLGAFLDERSGGKWPKGYWTMAVAGRTQVFFTEHGVWQSLVDGTVRQLSSEPAPLGLAVRASCAVPGIIEPVKYKGIYLFDGALSWDGQCPIGAVMKHYDVPARSVVACDVGDREVAGASLANRFWRFFCGTACVWPIDEKDPQVFADEGAVVATPAVNNFGSLQFTLSLDQKWEGVMSGYAAMITELWKKGYIDNKRWVELSSIATDVDVFRVAVLGN